MPKMKTHKGLAKRVKVTARGKVKYKASNSGHLMSHKRASRVQRLRRRRIMDAAFAAKVRRAVQA